MNVFGAIIGISAWIFIDVYLGMKIKNISNSNIKRSRKGALIILNIVIGIMAIILAFAI